MFTQSLSPLFSLPQLFLREVATENHQHSRKQGIEDDKQNKFQNQLVDDLYQPTQIAGSDDSEVVNSKMAVQSLSTSMSQSSEIKVTTQDGDEVTISFNQSVISHRSDFQMKQGDSKITAYEESLLFESGFSISIEGDLNEDEQKSVKQLMKKMDKVSRDFFQGNVKSAFEHAQKVGFDTEQIASFSMDLNMEKSVQAVVAYQQTILPEQKINTNMLKQAGEFLAQTKAFMVDSRASLDSLADHKQSFTDLFAAIGQLYSGAQRNMEESKDGEEPLFLKMIENISNDFFENKELA